MENVSEEILGNALIQVGKRIRAGKCDISQEQLDAIFASVESALDVMISKEEACALLGISRSTFDAKVLAGELPEGQHRRGFKEKFWSKRSLYGKER